MNAKQVKQAAFYLPENYDPSESPPHLRDWQAYFLNLIHWKTCCWKANEHGFVQLKQEYLRKVIPRKLWRELRDDLCRRKIVEEDLKIIVGEKCMGYRLTADMGKTHRTVCANETVNRKIEALQESKKVRRLPVHDWLLSNLLKIEIDFAAAARLIPSIVPESDSEGRYHNQLYEACKRITNKDHFLDPDKFGRVHTGLTTLPRELRSCLSAKGKRFIGIDLANSQPLMLGMFARKFYKDRMTRQRLLNKEFSDSKNPYCVLQNHDGAIPDDLAEYIRVCESGLFYEALSPPSYSEMDRTEIKVQFYRYLFDDNEHAAKSPIRAMFAARFPSAANVLWNLKRRNYRHSSHTLQNHEACVFIAGVATNLMKAYPDLIIFTVHDSIFCHASCVPKVKQEILNVFGGLGIHPTLHLEGAFS